MLKVILSVWACVELVAATQQHHLNPSYGDRPGAFIELKSTPQNLVTPLIESANMYNPGASSEAMQKLAEIFAKEPPAASGSSGSSKPEDVLGLDNDPLDIIGIGSDEVDTDALAAKVNMLKQQIANDEKTKAALPTKQSELTALQSKLNASLAKQSSAREAAQTAQQANVQSQLAAKNAQTSSQLDTQISELQNQISSLQAQKSQLNATASSSSGSSANATAFVEDSAKESRPAKLSSKVVTPIKKGGNAAHLSSKSEKNQRHHEVKAQAQKIEPKRQQQQQRLHFHKTQPRAQQTRKV